MEGQPILPAADNRQGDHHADRLGGHRGQGGAGRAQVKALHQQQVAPDVDHTGQHHREQRRPGVTDAPEHRPQHVVGHDEQAAAAADADVLHRFGKGLLWRVQKAGKGLGSGQQYHHQQHPEHREQADAAADGPSGLVRLTPPDALAHQNGDAHGQAGDHHGHGGHEHASGGDAGDIGGGSELPHHQQVHAAVQRLQKQREKDRNGKADEGVQDVPLRQSVRSFHVILSSVFSQ